MDFKADSDYIKVLINTRIIMSSKFLYHIKHLLIIIFKHKKSMK